VHWSADSYEKDAEMAKAITLFSGYSQKENRVASYCLLILKMLYEGIWSMLCRGEESRWE
jgi:hypothetical protein